MSTYYIQKEIIYLHRVLMCGKGRSERVTLFGTIDYVFIGFRYDQLECILYTVQKGSQLNFMILPE